MACCRSTWLVGAYAAGLYDPGGPPTTMSIALSSAGTQVDAYAHELKDVPHSLGWAEQQTDEVQGEVWWDTAPPSPSQCWISKAAPTHGVTFLAPTHTPPRLCFSALFTCDDALNSRRAPHEQAAAPVQLAHNVIQQHLVVPAPRQREWSKGALGAAAGEASSPHDGHGKWVAQSVCKPSCKSRMANAGLMA